MIEVEKKFQPTEEQLKALLSGAEFLGEVANHDIYYDYEDFRLLKQDIRLRNRNGNFELKIGKKISTNEPDTISEEIEEEEEIKKYFNTTLSIRDFVDKNMIILADWINNRKQYKKGVFNIDLDDMDFGYKLCEIEVMIEDESKAEDAFRSILEFAKQYGIEIKKVASKRETYLRLKRPDLYAKFYGA